MQEQAYKNYLLTVLLLIFVSNYLDRVALGLLLQNIKSDLHLSDTQLGLLTGIAFAFFYSLMGIPIGRWGDRGNRVKIISITIVLWSAAVALCGVAGTFFQLLLIRVFVGVGEAGCLPLSQSLISDYFTRAERPRAIGRYYLGAPLSYFVGYFLTGRLNEAYGWRVTFMLLALPGLVLAALTWFTLKEPRSGKQASSVALSPAEQPSFKEVWITLWENATFRHLVLAYSVASIFGVGLFQWKPAFFIRSYGLGTVEIGNWFSIIYGVSGVLGMYIGGEIATRFASHKEQVQLKYTAIAYCFFAVISAAMFLSPNPYLAFSLMALASFGLYASFGPLFATIQTSIPPRMRAVALAILYMIANLIGMGLSPLLVGVISDGLRPVVGEESLRYALLAMCPGYIWAGWHIWCASKTVMRDLKSAEVERDAPLEVA